jgi:enoyl-CoA hydratase
MDLICEKKAALVFLTVNREESFNALNSNVLRSIEERFNEMEQDDEAMVVIITGAGQKAFVAGADLKEIKDSLDRPELIRKGHKAFSAIRRSSKIVIAAVNGYALGGGVELALSCDIRFASENAKFGFPEAGLGLIPGYGGTQLTPRLIGSGKASYLMFTGDIISASEAFKMGLIEKVFKSEKLMEEVTEIAKKISTRGPLALKAIKNAVKDGRHLSLEEAMEVELREYAAVAHSADAEEGMESFMEKRKPVFRKI